MSVSVDNPISLRLVLDVILGNWGKILLSAIVFGLAAILLTPFRPRTYESTTTLLIAPPTFKDPRRQYVELSPGSQPESIAELMPRALPMEAYRAIALSPSMLADVVRLIPEEKIGVGALQKRLSVDLVQMGSRTGTGIMYTQTILLRARANSAELAAKIADAWAKVFKEQMDAVANRGIAETFSLLDTLHASTKADIERADLNLAEHKKAWNLDLMQAQLEAKQKQYTEFEAKLKETEVNLASAEKKVEALENELAKEPKTEVYFRAPTDDAYWITKLQGNGTPKLQPDQGLRTEEPNENYVDARKEAVKAVEDLEGFKAARDAILAKLAELGKEQDALTVTFADQTVERDRLTRESDSLKAAYKIVRAQYEKGRMAEKTQSSDIVIAGNAVPPDIPVSLSHTKFVVVAVMAGIFVSVAILLLGTILRTGFPRGANKVDPVESA